MASPTATADSDDEDGGADAAAPAAGAGAGGATVLDLSHLPVAQYKGTAQRQVSEMTLGKSNLKSVLIRQQMRVLALEAL